MTDAELQAMTPFGWTIALGDGGWHADCWLASDGWQALGGSLNSTAESALHLARWMEAAFCDGRRFYRYRMMKRVQS